MRLGKGSPRMALTSNNRPILPEQIQIPRSLREARVQTAIVSFEGSFFVMPMSRSLTVPKPD